MKSKKSIGNEKQKQLSISALPRPSVENCLLTAQRSINLILGILELSKREKNQPNKNNPHQQEFLNTYQRYIT